MDVTGYTDLRPLAHGGISTVYRAHQVASIATSRPKILHVDLSDDAARSRFEREVRARWPCRLAP